MTFLFRLFPVLLLAQLVACNSSSDEGPPPAPEEIALQADCSGANCSASGSAYTGSGIGVWAAENRLDQRAVVNIDLSGLPPEARVTLVLTNQGPSARKLPAGTLTAPAGSSDPIVSSGRRQTQLTSGMRQPFQHSQRLPLAGTSPLPWNVLPVKHYLTGDTKVWTNFNGPTAAGYATTLRSQAPLSNGRVVNIWVADEEWGPFQVTQELADIYAEKFAAPTHGVFDMVTALYGAQPWGPFPVSAGFMINPEEDIQIVMVPITQLAGYYSPGNNLAKTGASGSDEALAFFMSAANAYDPRFGIGFSAPVLGHEFVHMLNFYNRQVLDGAIYADWLEEMSAMSLHEMIGSRINPDDRLGWWTGQWLEDGLYNCALNRLSLEQNCNSYAVGGAFANWLMRQYGLPFFHDLTDSPRQLGVPDGIVDLDRAIRQQDPESSFSTALRRWGASIALLDASQLPAGYGYPLREETVNGVTYTLKALSGPDFRDRQTMPGSLPSTLQPYAHAPLRFAADNGRFRRSVILPPQTALTVVVN